MKSFFNKVRDRAREGFKKTRGVMEEGIRDVLHQNPRVDPDFYDDLEAVLLRADIGPTTTDYLVEELQIELQKRRFDSTSEIRPILQELMARVLTEGSTNGGTDSKGASESPALTEGRADAFSPPSVGGEVHVVLIAGVNGVGKTTTLAKLVHRAKESGRKPLIVASDTFRAAASEQLEVWARRLDVGIVRSQTGSDPGSVAFDGIRAATARGCDLVLIDTAGRLQTKDNLMEELRKIHRVCGKAMEGAPHESLLVLDATIGQNAMSQARLFSDAIPVTGIVLSKLDGTSKGGVILAIAHELKIPVRFVGVGEQAEDLLEFDPALFAKELVGEGEE